MRQDPFISFPSIKEEVDYGLLCTGIPMFECAAVGPPPWELTYWPWFAAQDMVKFKPELEIVYVFVPAGGISAPEPEKLPSGLNVAVNDPMAVFVRSYTVYVRVFPVTFPATLYPGSPSMVPVNVLVAQSPVMSYVRSNVPQGLFDESVHT